MNRRKNNRRKRNEEKKSHRIVRCTNQNQPKFESDVCNHFKTRVKGNDQNNCKNCTHSL